MKKVQWNSLLNEIKNHRVVPIVGNELLEIEVNGERVSLYEKVATELAEELEIKLDTATRPSPTLNDVAFAFREEGGDLLDVSYQVAEILRTHSEVIPEPLRKLAEIRHFDLFISTTPDSLLKMAIDEMRFGGQSRTVELAYSTTSELSDLPDNYSPRPNETPTIYQIFGTAQFAPDFVVTEDDLLKYVNKLQTHDHRPENLLEILHPRSLAWIGTNYPDWLIRFLLCSAKSESLFVTKSIRGYVADQKTVNDAGLRRFFTRHRAILYDTGDAISFINELHSRWMERFGDDTSDADQPNSPTDIAAKSFPKNGVFISYASEDIDAATMLGKAFSEYGIRVWWDKKDLAAGDQFDEVIRINIKSCSIFLPLISQNTQTLEQRYFRREWHYALDAAVERPPNFPFIQPIVIDDTDVTAEDLPREFLKRHCPHFPGGSPDDAFLDRTKQIVRDWSRQQRRSS